MACKCYHAERNFIGKIGVCWGTKECEACSCGGDEAKCDFYDYVRERASLSQKPKQTNADQFRVKPETELATILAEAECPSDLGGKDKCKDGTTDTSICRECWLEWLRQEAHDDY